MPDDLAPYGYLGGVNRSAVTVTPREPYLVWARAVFADEKEPPTTYPTDSVTLLIPPTDDAGEDGAVGFLRENSGMVFREMLTRWCRDPAKWPAGVDDWTEFNSWFETRYTLDVLDFDDEALEHYGEEDDGVDDDGDELNEEDEDDEDPEDAAWLTEVMELRLRPHLYDLLRALTRAMHIPEPLLVAALDEAPQHRKGRVVRAEQKVWSLFLHLLDAGEKSADFVRAKLSRELIALIRESRGRRW
jgi:hypothetical protein